MRHYEDSLATSVSPKELFNYVDDFSRFSSHMSESSWMMGGSTMQISTDEGNGQKVGSVVRMGGRIFGATLSLEEVVTEREPPRLKVWRTIGVPRLLVIGNYQMRVAIEPRENASLLRVEIDYDLPPTNRWLGYLFGGTYAKWCVRQMIDGVRKRFA